MRDNEYIFVETVYLLSFFVPDHFNWKSCVLYIYIAVINIKRYYIVYILSICLFLSATETLYNMYVKKPYIFISSCVLVKRSSAKFSWVKSFLFMHVFHWSLFSCFWCNGTFYFWKVINENFFMVIKLFHLYANYYIKIKHFIEHFYISYIEKLKYRI
jgi:hypothetical protein